MAKKRVTFTLDESTIERLKQISKDSMIPQARIIESLILEHGEKFINKNK